MLNHLKKTVANKVETENGALAYAHSGSAVLDLFSKAGAARNVDDSALGLLIRNALADDYALAILAIFHLGDIRGGQGERRFFKLALKELVKYDSELAGRILHLIPEYSRWDLVYEFVDTALEKQAFAFMHNQFLQDLASDAPSLLAKWLKSENASSPETVALARKTAKAFDLTPRQYRKGLAALRAKIDVVERKMSANKWKAIELPKLPGRAFSTHTDAWKRHIPEAFTSFITKAEKGEVKMKADVLYPHEILKLALSRDDRAASALWSNLPDYVKSDEYIVPVVDVSGSMSGLPLEVAVSLGMYVAERLKGEFKDHFISFSSRPQLIEIRGATLADKFNNMVRTDWEMNTDLAAVFRLILNTAVKNNLPANEMPTKLLIMSDMQFDRCILQGEDTILESMAKMFAAKGYALPKVLFWDLATRIGQSPVEARDENVAMISGFSPKTLQYVLGGTFKNPFETMLEVLNSKRYEPVREALNRIY